MKRAILLTMSFVVLVSCILVACSKGNDTSTDDETNNGGIIDNGTEYGFETVPVTDENGEEVTDENGDVVTTEIAVAYKGDTAIPLDENGEEVTDEDGEKVSFKITTTAKTTDTTTAKQESTKPTEVGDHTTTTTEPVTATTKKDVPLTSSKETTRFTGTDSVPKTSDSGNEVNFSAVDQAAIKAMLEVPYLYLENYENSDGVPIEIARHTAVWMAERDGSTRTTYPASPIVLNLFKYYGQTVVNFKTGCNSGNSGSTAAPIKYISSNDTFEITGFTSRKQVVTITKIEDLGNNNYYKVTATVSNCNKKSVIAIVQKNRLDTTLGFSIKALKWS